MKKCNFILSLAMITVTLFTSCQNENALVSQPEVPSALADSMKNAAGKTTGTSGSTTTSSAVSKVSFTESEVSPKFGRPNSTNYSFKVYDLSGKLTISVKLYDKSTGSTKYYSMTRVGNYWTLSMKISSNGWYDWRYVYSVSKSNISSKAYTLCNTYNTFSSSGISSITWPFGADGSSWNRRVIDSQKWIGGEERKLTNEPGGYGWNEGTHKATDRRERYSDDWNRGTGSQDFGAEIYSPLDGYVEISNGSYTTEYGRSKFVSVIQKGSDGRLYRFYVAHLDQINANLYEGMYVRAGITRLGALGKSGASSPHAHCNLRDVTDGDDKSIKFYFDAK